MPPIPYKSYLPTVAEPVKVLEGDCLTWLPKIPDNSVDAVITDPPYHRVKGEAWDRQWKTDDDYLVWLGRVADEWRRVLRPNGSLYCFASPRMVARVELLIGERFNVLNRIVWAKPEFSTKAEMNPKEWQRNYFPTTEYIVFAEQFGSDGSAADESGYFAQCEAVKRSVVGEYLRAEFKRAGVVNRQIAALFPSASGGLTGCVSNWLLGYNMPTPEQYAAMRAWLNEKDGRGGYLRREYEDLRRPFEVSPDVPYTDVWSFPTVNRYPGKHPCEKPLALKRHIITASTRPGALILDPFAGSGTTGVAALNTGRRCLMIEKEPKYAEIARKRIADQALTLAAS